MIGEFRDPELTGAVLALRWKAMPVCIRASRLPWTWAIAMGDAQIAYITNYVLQSMEGKDAPD